MNKSEKVFPPGKYIKDELEKRGWTQTDVAFFLGRSSSVEINNLITGKKKITPEVAQELAAVFSSAPEYWLNLENKYRLTQIEDVDESINRKVRLFSTFPVKEILKRNWVENTEDIEELEKRLFDFLGIKSIDEQPHIAHAAKKSTTYNETTVNQAAWMIRAYNLAPAVMVAKFSEESLLEAFEKLRLILFNVEEIRHVPRILANAGIRFLIVETLSNSKIDGVTFWLDKKSPVIVLSMRFDRIDAFWQALLHELDHVKHLEGQDMPIIDSNLIGEGATKAEDKPEFERRADSFAANFSIPSKELEKFITRIHPLYTRDKILGFSARIKVHPGIVVGQLQHEGKIPYSHFRDFLIKARNIITASALTDGWGNTPLI